MAGALPEFVRERDEQLLELDVHLGPPGVREAAPRDAGVYTVLDQEPLAVWLVLRPRTVQLPRVEDLAGVVDGDAEPDEAHVNRDAHAPEVRNDRLRGLAYQPEVR